MRRISKLRSRLRTVLRYGFDLPNLTVFERLFFIGSVIALYIGYAILAAILVSTPIAIVGCAVDPIPEGADFLSCMANEWRGLGF